MRDKDKKFGMDIFLAKMISVLICFALFYIVAMKKKKVKEKRTEKYVSNFFWKYHSGLYTNLFPQITSTKLTNYIISFKPVKSKHQI